MIATRTRAAIAGLGCVAAVFAGVVAAAPANAAISKTFNATGGTYTQAANLAQVDADLAGYGDCTLVSAIRWEPRWGSTAPATWSVTIRCYLETNATSTMSFFGSSTNESVAASIAFTQASQFGYSSNQCTVTSTSYDSFSWWWTVGITCTG